MKFTGKTLTLRGTTSPMDPGAWYSENILDYANVLDINKAWKIKWFEVWSAESLGLQSAGSRVYWSLESLLSTENILNVANRADDNRLIAWSNQYYGMGESPSSKAQGIVNAQVIIDPDHIIQKELNINFLPLTGSTLEGTTLTMNFIVYLEEVDITATESIIYTIKQSAQSLNE